MNRRVVFGPSGIPALVFAALVFAVSVSSCYDPNFASSVTSVRFDRSSMDLGRSGDYLDTGDLVLALRPSGATGEVMNIEWIPADGSLIEFLPDAPPSAFDGEGRAVVTVLFAPFADLGETGKESVGLTARVDLYDGSSHFALCTIHLHDD